MAEQWNLWEYVHLVLRSILSWLQILLKCNADSLAMGTMYEISCFIITAVKGPDTEFFTQAKLHFRAQVSKGSVTEENKYSNGQFLLLTLPPPLTPSYNLNFWHHDWLLWHLETVRIIKYKTVTFCKVKNGKQIERSSKNSFEINKPISKQTLDLIVGYPILKGKGDSLKTREHSGQKARSPRYDKPRPFVKS